MTETTTAPVSHRLVTMRAAYALCSCGARYEAVGSAAQRDAHRAHKAEPAAAPKSRARKALAKAAAK